MRRVTAPNFLKPRAHITSQTHAPFFGHAVALLELLDLGQTCYIGELFEGCHLVAHMRNRSGALEFGEDGMIIDVGETISVKRLSPTGR